MNEIIELVAMGKYGVYVWSSVAISLLLLISIFVYSFKRYRRLNQLARNIGLKDIF